MFVQRLAAGERPPAPPPPPPPTESTISTAFIAWHLAEAAAYAAQAAATGVSLPTTTPVDIHLGDGDQPLNHASATGYTPLVPSPAQPPPSATSLIPPSSLPPDWGDEPATLRVAASCAPALLDGAD